MHAVDLAGKTALVTGAGKRVGRAVAEELGRAGARIAVHYHRSRDGAEALAASLPGAFAVGGDLRTAEGCRALLADVRARTGRLECLVNSAADYARGPFSDEDDATWEAMLALDLVAPARLIRGALPLGLVAVVNVVDIMAFVPIKRHAAYAAAKAGFAHLSRCLALELAPAVRVNGVAPGTVAFPPDFRPEEQAAVLRRIPLGRIGAPEDVARATRFLLEEDYLTGVLLPVDGGAALA
jgi:pteridine reductase